MFKRLAIAVLPALVVGVAALPARADFSACAGAYTTKDPHQQIDLYTICLKHGGLVSTDVAGAFNNRGIAYEQIGEQDKALQDYTWAIQYDPNWPTFYSNRARIEAQKGKCPEALADISRALKLHPHEKGLLDMKARLVAACPTSSTQPAS